MQELTGKPNLPEALRLLGEWTQGSYDIWRLSGNHNAANRAIIMSQLVGKKQPQSKAGVTMLESTFYQAVGVVEGCGAVRQDDFVAKVRGRAA